MTALLLIIGLVLGGGAGWFLRQYLLKKNPNSFFSKEELEKLLEENVADKLAQIDIEIEKRKKEAEEYITARKKELLSQEELLVKREKVLNERSQTLEEKLAKVEQEQEALQLDRQKIEDLRVKLQTELEKTSNLTREEAREKLIKEINDYLVSYKAKQIRQAEQEIKAVADEKAKEILVSSMQRIVTDYVGETTTSTIKIDDEKVKARVIGKEGRNIRTFEKLTGVDVIIDESPNAIALSSFDSLRREIAKVALQKLVKDGRIHPGTIEDEVRKAKVEIAQEIKQNGQILAEEAGWLGMDPKLLQLVGKLKYRTSYGQTLMQHTIEVIRIGAMLASELNADVDLVKKACLLHDIGKVLTHKIEGQHHHISGQIARKYGLNEKLVNAIEAHHLDIEPQSVEAVIVYLADAISGARPGARRDSYEAYIKRVEGLENVAKEIAGDKAKEIYAIHAGRELRIIVVPEKISDDEITVLANDISKKVEESQTYPGIVKITVIRESRAEAIAK